MPNQYGKMDGGKLYGGNLPSKFSVMLDPELAETWDKMARRVKRDKAELFRELIRFTAKRVDEFYQRYPDFGPHTLEFGIRPILEAYYDAGKIAMQQEDSREYELMTAYQDAKRRDGGKVNYRADSRAVQLHLKAWAKGVTVQSLLEEWAKTKAAIRQTYEVDPDEYPIEDPNPYEPEPPPVEPQAQARQTQTASSNLDDWVYLPRGLWWGILGLGFVLTLAIVGLLLAYLGAIWAK